MDISNILGDYKKFVKRLISDIERKQINLTGSMIDHIGYRVASLRLYKEMKINLLPFSKTYTENIHNGREISIYKLKKPLKIAPFEIPMVELPSPRMDKPYQTGLEHIEIVVPDYENFKKQYQMIFTDIHNKNCYNELLFVTFSSSMTVKFHSHPLDAIVEHEGNVFINI